MNREIKFKFWDEEYKCMREAEVISPRNKFAAAMGLKTSEGQRNCSLHDLMQFTGLKDKKGKDIYECDVVEDSDGERRVVSFESGAWLAGDHYLYDLTECKIIGNIYENKDLLTTGDNNEI